MPHILRLHSGVLCWPARRATSSFNTEAETEGVDAIECQQMPVGFVAYLLWSRQLHWHRRLGMVAAAEWSCYRSTMLIRVHSNDLSQTVVTELHQSTHSLPAMKWGRGLKKKCYWNLQKVPWKNNWHSQLFTATLQACFGGGAVQCAPLASTVSSLVDELWNKLKAWNTSLFAYLKNGMSNKVHDCETLRQNIKPVSLKNVLIVISPARFPFAVVILQSWSWKRKITH